MYPGWIDRQETIREHICILGIRWHLMKWGGGRGNKSLVQSVLSFRSGLGGWVDEMGIKYRLHYYDRDIKNGIGGWGGEFVASPSLSHSNGVCWLNGWVSSEWGGSAGGKEQNNWIAHLTHSPGSPCCGVASPFLALHIHKRMVYMTNSGSQSIGIIDFNGLIAGKGGVI